MQCAAQPIAECPLSDCTRSRRSLENTLDKNPTKPRKVMVCPKPLQCTAPLSSTPVEAAPKKAAKRSNKKKAAAAAEEVHARSFASTPISPVLSLPCNFQDGPSVRRTPQEIRAAVQRVSQQREASPVPVVVSVRRNDPYAAKVIPEDLFNFVEMRLAMPQRFMRSSFSSSFSSPSINASYSTVPDDDLQSIGYTAGNISSPDVTPIKSQARYQAKATEFSETTTVFSAPVSATPTPYLSRSPSPLQYTSPEQPARSQTVTQLTREYHNGRPVLVRKTVA